MIQLRNEIVSLRAIEPVDIELLFDLENDVELWKYSNRSQPYSRDLLQNYIANAHKTFSKFVKSSLPSLPKMTLLWALSIYLTTNLCTTGQGWDW